jgi:hypothetical protein
MFKDENVPDYHSDRVGGTAESGDFLVNRASPVMAELLIELQALDLANRELLLDWLVRFHEAWVIGVEVDSQGVAMKLMATDLYQEIRTTPDVQPANREEHATFLIGQAVAWLQDGSGFPEVFPHFVERWRVRSW